MMGWQHISDTTPKARKEYQCCLCGEIIPIGEKHVYRFGSDDGDGLSSRMHIECEEAASDWDNLDWESSSVGCMERPAAVSADRMEAAGATQSQK